MSSVLDDFRKLPDFSAFEAFSKALWDNEAAVMVGAGFSKVCMRENDSPMPPLWGDFAKFMETSLGYTAGRGPDALRLAQEYRAQHGQDGLYRLIRQLVTDEQWEPSRLHRQLVELPWRDILTTNWDTLLERTSPRTPDRIYSCVRTVDDIARQRSPRIVKLHGSLPSHTPLVFTEDDFRRYPTQFAPFVNLAQQVMLENELCLLGFSGIDPNFLAWSGWVRDTLHISARRIRLIGVLNLTPAARILLEQRNVTPIDLGPLVKNFDPSQEHEQALVLFFAALAETKPPSPFEWKLGDDHFNVSTSVQDMDKATRGEVAAAWAADRAGYPGWVVGPYSEVLGLLSSHPTLRTADEKSEDHLRFAYERLWRHRTAGAWPRLADIEESDKYFDGAANTLAPSERTDLCINACSNWRVSRKWDHWSKWMKRLAAIPGDEPQLWHAYEIGLKAILDWDDAGVQKAADALTSSAPIWMMRRAGLLSALFQDKASADLYQAALMEVRRKLRSAPNSAWLISLEGWGSLFYSITHMGHTGDLTSHPERDSDETRLRYIGAKADPWDEISRHDRLALERTERNREDTENWELSFRTGRFKQADVRFYHDDECPFYGLLAMMERIGAPERSGPVNLFSNRLVAAYRALKDPNDDDLMTFLARYRGTDLKILDHILPRRRIARMNKESLETVRDGVVARIARMQTNQGRSRTDGHILFLFCLLARVIIRSESAKSLEIFRWCQNVLVSPGLLWTGYKECGEILKSAIEAMSDENRKTAIILSLEFKLPGEVGAVGGNRDRPEFINFDSQVIYRDWPESLDEFSSNEISGFTVEKAASRRIDQLIDLVQNGDRLNRTRALTRLQRFSQKLTEVQSAALKQAIWSRCDGDGWPADTDLLPSFYLTLPGRSRAEPLFFTTIVEAVAGGKISHDLLRTLRSGISESSMILDYGMLTACIETCVEWRPMAHEMDAIHSFFDDASQTETETAKEIGYALAQALLPAVTMENMTDDLALTIAKIPELEHIPTISAVAFHLGRLLPDMKDVGVDMIRAAIASRDLNRVNPTFVSIKHYVSAVNDGALFPNEIMELLLNMVEQRLQPGLGIAMNFIGDLIVADVMIQKNLDRLAKALPEVVQEYRYNQDRLSVPSLVVLPEVRRQAHRLIGLMVDAAPNLGTLKEELDLDPLPEVRRAHGL